MGRPACIRNIADVPAEPYERASGIAGIVRDIGAAVGTERLGIDVTTIEPGRKSSYLHSHKHKEEFFYVLKGRCSVRIGGESFDLAEGDAVSRPAGTGVPHQFSNPFDVPCDVMMLGIPTSEGVEDEVHWPELKRVMKVDPEGRRTVAKERA